MTDIENGNKLIAEFLGYPFYIKECYNVSGTPIECETNRYTNVFYKNEFTNKYGSKLPNIYESQNRIYIRDLSESIHNPNYNTSYGSLMPVVQKIESLDYKTLKIYNNVTFGRTKHIDICWSVGGITDCGNGTRTISTIAINSDSSDILALYKTVVGCIEWYNTQK